MLPEVTPLTAVQILPTKRPHRPGELFTLHADYDCPNCKGRHREAQIKSVCLKPSPMVVATSPCGIRFALYGSAATDFAAAEVRRWKEL